MKIDRVVTHVDCPDGYASAKIAYDYLSAAPPEIVFVQYQTPEHAALEPLPNGGRTLFVDMTPPREKADAFLENGDVVLDHHEYASDIIMSFVQRGQGVMGNNGLAECGARLLCNEKQAGPWDAPHHVRRILDRADAIVGPPEEIGLTAKWLVMGQLDEVDEKRVMRLLTVDYERRALHTNCRRPGSVIKSLMDAKKRGRRRVMRYRRLGGRSFARLLAMQHPWWFT